VLPVALEGLPVVMPVALREAPELWGPVALPQH
jgi:hypothetical protein